jgi:arabinogalactan endo-1,4-beta-galactosidase
MLIIGLALLAMPISTAMADDFVRGADVSWLPQMEATGFKFLGKDGKPQDCLQILKEHGINTIRLRVFVNPTDNPHDGHCGKEDVVAMSVRAHDMGFRLLIDFHYSDSWADPIRQQKPAKWATHSIDQLVEDVHDHTADVLGALKAKGITPEWVQVGNEIPDGMLWPEGKVSQGPNLSRLINAGYRAVKENDPKTKVIVHLDRGNDGALYQYFFDRLEQHGAQFDVIGMSYYPYWLKTDYTQSIDDLGKTLVDTAARYKKQVMIVEIGGDDGQPNNTFDMITAAIEKVRAVPNGAGLGVLYWEPEGAASWSKYRLSCWGQDGRPTRALEAFLEKPMPSTRPAP